MITEYREITDEDLENLPLETWYGNNIEMVVYVHNKKVCFVDECGVLDIGSVNSIKCDNKIKVENPITVEWIKENCVIGETVFVDEDGVERVYVGYQKHMIYVLADYGGLAFSWNNAEIRNWKVKK